MNTELAGSPGFRPTDGHGAARISLRWCLGVVAVGAMCDTACAADFTAGPRKSDLNTLRLFRQADEVLENADKSKSEPAEPTTSVGLGAAYQRSSGEDHSFTTPFIISYTPNNWYFEVSGDGYMRAHSAEGRSNGVGDVSLIANYTLQYGANKYALAPEYELVIPSHGQVGSPGFTQVGRLSWTLNQHAWALTLRGAIARDSYLTAGKSRYTEFATGKLQFTDPGNKDKVISLALKRTYQRGGEGTTDLRAELDFPLSVEVVDNTRKKWLGSVSAVHRLSGGRSDSLEFDVAYWF